MANLFNDDCYLFWNTISFIENFITGINIVTFMQLFIHLWLPNMRFNTTKSHMYACLSNCKCQHSKYYVTCNSDNRAITSHIRPTTDINLTPSTIRNVCFNINNHDSDQQFMYVPVTPCPSYDCSVSIC